MCDQLRVLIVDDCHDTLLMLSQVLRIFNCEVRTCSDGMKAAQTVKEFSPHVIFLDLGMPDLDGYEVAEDLDAQKSHDYMLIALTGYADEVHRRECERSGFDYFLAKPASLEQIKSIVEAARARFVMADQT